MHLSTHRHLIPLALVCSAPFAALSQTVEGPKAAPEDAASITDPALDPGRFDFRKLKALGAEKSRYLAPRFAPEVGLAPSANLLGFRDHVEPILNRACLPCHGPSKSKGGVRVDELDPDLFQGEDVEWWLDVLSVVSNGEMPPPEETELSDDDRGKLIEWLSTEVQMASSARKAGGEHSTFRRMTRYEYEYALQDLFGLPYRFADDLPPDPTSEDGFQNSSELLHLTQTQLQAYFESNRKALDAATVRGERPAPLYWDVSMEAAARAEWERQNQQVAKARK